MWKVKKVGAIIFFSLSEKKEHIPPTTPLSHQSCTSLIDAHFVVFSGGYSQPNKIWQQRKRSVRPHALLHYTHTSTTPPLPVAPPPPPPLLYSHTPSSPKGLSSLHSSSLVLFLAKSTKLSPSGDGRWFWLLVHPCTQSLSGETCAGPQASPTRRRCNAGSTF